MPWTVHFANLHALFFNSLARTAPRCTSNFWRQSTFPECWNKFNQNLLLFQSTAETKKYAIRLHQAADALVIIVPRAAHKEEYANQTLATTIEESAFDAYNFSQPKSTMLEPNCSRDSAHLTIPLIERLDIEEHNLVVGSRHNRVVLAPRHKYHVVTKIPFAVAVSGVRTFVFFCWCPDHNNYKNI